MVMSRPRRPRSRPRSPDDDLPADLGSDWRAISDAKSAAKQREYVCLLASTEEGQPPMLGLSRSGVRVLVQGETEVQAALDGLTAAELSPSGYDLKQICRDYGVAPGPQSLDFGVCSYLYDPSVGDHAPADIVERFLDEAVAEAAPSPPAMVRGLEQMERLSPVMRRALVKHRQQKLYDDIELPLVAILGRLEALGILLDTKLLAKLSKDFDKRMKALVGTVYEAAGQEFNILSPVQLREILFVKLKLPTKGIKKTKTGPSTDSDSLTALADKHPLPALVLEYRGLAKLKSTYVDSLPRMVDANSRIHTRLNQTVTATGRLSSKDPNLQNIPIRTDDGRRIRGAFVAGKGRLLVSADYNQIELRVLAHLANDSALIAAFEQGLDIHSATAAELFGIAATEVTPAMRRTSKVINYGIIYGMGPVRMSRELGISRSDAAGYIESYFERYAGVRKFYDETLAEARETGYVATLLGRRRYLPDIQSEHGGLRQAAERVATNTPIQGSAADIIKQAMIRLDRALGVSGLEAALVLQIHDELLLECPEAELDQVVTLVRDAMEGAAELVVPIQADIGSGPDWGSAH
jgi:DNA polymerase-1